MGSPSRSRSCAGGEEMQRRKHRACGPLSEHRIELRTHQVPELGMHPKGSGVELARV